MTDQHHTNHSNNHSHDETPMATPTRLRPDRGLSTPTPTVTPPKHNTAATPGGPNHHEEEDLNTMHTTSPTPRIGAGRRGRRVAIGAAAAGLVLLAACGTSSSSDATSATSGASRSGTTPEYASELRPVLEDLVASMKVPSAVVLVRSSTYGDATFSFGSRVLGGTTRRHPRIAIGSAASPRR
jgi:hypothetical protein